MGAIVRSRKSCHAANMRIFEGSEERRWRSSFHYSTSGPNPPAGLCPSEAYLVDPSLVVKCSEPSDSSIILYSTPHLTCTVATKGISQSKGCLMTAQIW